MDNDLARLIAIVYAAMVEAKTGEELCILQSILDSFYGGIDPRLLCRREGVAPTELVQAR